VSYHKVVAMNNEKLVEVEYHNPERNTMECGVGWLRETSHHLLLIHERIEGADLYSYAIIPRDFVRRIIQLKIK